MKLTVLDKKHLENRSWFLCKGKLLDYLENLKKDFYKFSIQRKIIKNQYLDSLVETIKQGDPIPIITLTINKDPLIVGDSTEFDLNLEQTDILDGLQRTFRLWAYHTLIKEHQNKEISDPKEFARIIKDKYQIFFDTGILNLTKIKKIYENDEFNRILDSFENFEIYLIIWANLTPKEVIHKMLVLNAGQRSVSITHQFELLFLYLWEDLQKENLGVNLFREKDEKASKVKIGVRDAGDYMFSSVIVGLRSFLEQKPLRVSIEDLDITGFEDEISLGINEDVFNVEFIRTFLTQLKELDAIIIEKEGESGNKWFVKDTTISGVLAGLGTYCQVRDKMSIELIEKVTLEGFTELKKRIKEFGFKLNEFQDEYNFLSSRSVNIGNFIRKVVMKYTESILIGKPQSWKKLFHEN